MGLVYSDGFQDYDKAIECYVKTIEIKPYLAAVYYNIGLAYEIKANKDKCIVFIKKAAQLGFDPAKQWLKDKSIIE